MESWVLITNVCEWTFCVCHAEFWGMLQSGTLLSGLVQFNFRLFSAMRTAHTTRSCI